MQTHEYLPKEILKNFTLGFDPNLFTKSSLNLNFGKSLNLKSIKNNLIDEIYKKNFSKIKQFYSIKKKYVGESHQSKINRVINLLQSNGIDYLFISAPENVAWLMNVRGYDHPNSPIPNAQLIIGSNKKIFLIVENNKFSNLLKEKKFNKNQIINTKNFKEFIKELKGNTFAIDNLSCSIFNEQIINHNFEIISKNDPCYKLKAIKNSTEIDNTITSHLRDGLALTKFIFWIKNVNKKKITEIEAKNKLEKFRKFDNSYLFPSFDTIAGTGSNGAIVHYRVNKKTNKIIKKNHLFLCDSGGQYKYGTTDVTRTICFSKQPNLIKNIYTKVLKGHIAVVTADLNKFNTGKKIDVLARKFLKKSGLDYAHGTGHGVGFFLNVHEGPMSISKFNNVKLEEGMILSNEPGYYKKDSYGIRIENLIYIKNEKNKLFFKNLTLAPIEKDLINYDLLDKAEKDYLFRYHLKIYSTYSKFLNLKERKWLASLI